MKGGRQAGVGRREWNPPLQFSPSLPFELWSHTDCVLEENKEKNEPINTEDFTRDICYPS